MKFGARNFVVLDGVNRPETVVKINTVTFSPTIKSCQAWIVGIVVFTIIKQPSKMRFF